jgi:hypothetical protein
MSCRGFILTVLVVAIAATACTSGPGKPASLGQARANVGIVYRGGPAPGNSNILRPGSIRILRPDGSAVATGRLKEGQSFRATLIPGTYRFEARSGNAQCQPRTLKFASGSESEVRISCSVK